MTRILVIRHGESEWNATGRWQGQQNAPLTDLGRRQAVAAGSRLGTVDAIVASDLDRALETAKLVAEHLGVGPVRAEARLRERHAGEWEGLTRAEIDARWPDFLGTGRRPPGWESDEELLDRVRACLVELAAGLVGGEALVFSHGGVIRALERAAGGDSQPIPNLGARWLDVTGDDIRLGDRVTLIDPDDVEITIPGQI